LADNFHYYFPELDKIGIISFEPFTQGKGRNIFEAKNQVIKAVLYERKQHRNFLAVEKL